MNDPKLTDCPQEGCDGPVKRLLGTGAGIIFKGSGFYQTDYRSESYKAGEKKASESSAPKKEKKETKPSKSSE
jgi:predicted nucleic acid-binding Zn ribbon protein